MSRDLFRVLARHALDHSAEIMALPNPEERFGGAAPRRLDWSDDRNWGERRPDRRDAP